MYPLTNWAHHYYSQRYSTTITRSKIKKTPIYFLIYTFLWTTKKLTSVTYNNSIPFKYVITPNCLYRNHPKLIFFSKKKLKKLNYQWELYFLVILSFILFQLF